MNDNEIVYTREYMLKLLETLSMAALGYINENNVYLDDSIFSATAILDVIQLRKKLEEKTEECILCKVENEKLKTENNNIIQTLNNVERILSQIKNNTSISTEIEEISEVIKNIKI